MHRFQNRNALVLAISALALVLMAGALFAWNTASIDSCTWSSCGSPGGTCTGTCSGVVDGSGSMCDYWWKVNNTVIQDGWGDCPLNTSVNLSCQFGDTVKLVGNGGVSSSWPCGAE